MKNYKDILLSPGSTIREALKIIDSGAIKILEFNKISTLKKFQDFNI